MDGTRCGLRPIYAAACKVGLMDARIPEPAALVLNPRHSRKRRSGPHPEGRPLCCQPIVVDLLGQPSRWPEHQTHVRPMS